MKSQLINILPYNGELYHLPNFFKTNLSIIEVLKKELSWRNDKIKMFGRVYPQKRKVAWCGDIGVTYTYSGIELVANGWSKNIDIINQVIRDRFNVNFNSCLINLYRNGEDYMSYHSDSERELGVNPEIFSVSFGATRDFLLKHKVTKEIVKIELTDGDLVIMRGETQHHWRHALPKRKRVAKERINLTFRQIYRLD